MITICFSGDGQFLCEQKWPFVPRIGERVILNNPSGCWRVTHVTWQFQKDELVAQVLMQELTGPTVR